MTKTVYVVSEIGDYHVLRPSGYYMRKSKAIKHLHEIASGYNASESKAEKHVWHVQGTEVARMDSIKVKL